MLRYGFFPAFKGGPSFLLWGEGVDMVRFTNFMQQRAKGSGTIRFGEADWSKAVDGATLSVVMGEHATGMQRGAGPLDFVWGLDEATAGSFAEKIGALARIGPAGHQHLQCGVSDEIKVMVSRSEYPPHHAP